ncbi:hypothetical protein PVK06_039972 [Gossypium arboreum]|uniref:Uncharacterized protein n=1 Tax=Gossypium arboreum TaxID=29729 RepID=A0ABR0N489_GOSAR|nr:hypothetical protein PVK06_039972 [Gossypium arboreum]
MEAIGTKIYKPHYKLQDEKFFMTVLAYRGALVNMQTRGLPKMQRQVGYKKVFDGISAKGYLLRKVRQGLMTEEDVQ